MKSKGTNKTLVGKIFFVYLTSLLILSFPIQAKAYSVVWIPERIEQTIALGETLDLTVTLRSSTNLRNAKLWVVPELQPFMTLGPAFFDTLEADIPQQVTLHFSIPPDSQAGKYDGTVHLRVGSRTYPKTLKVSLNVVYSGNHPPVADAGQDQDVTVGSLVTLDGRTSYDPDGNLITYRWAIVMAPSGSSANLNNPISVMPTFTPDIPGEYRISFTVNDGRADSAPDEVVIIATMPNVAPTANAGPDESVVTGSMVFLDGGGSFDPDGDPVTYLWQILSSPEGSTASLDYPSSATPTFIADKAGQYTISLTVNDGELDSLPDDVIVISAIPNAPPVSYAGDDQTVSKNTTIQLDGRGSSDPNNDPLTYSWTIVSKPVGSTRELNDPASPTPQIFADKGGDYVFRLIIFDGQLYSDSDTVVVTVVNDPPIAEAGPDQDGVVGVTITLNGSGSSDPDGDPLSYLWTLVSAPGGNSASIVNPTSITPTITPNVPGVYVIQLVVNDGSTDSSADILTLTIRITVPDVVGQPQASAEATIIAAGLTVGAITQVYSAVLPAGYVISQNPAGGTLALSGSSVALTISQGPAPVLVPDVVGMTQSDAETAILTANLVVGMVTTANSPTVPAGNVISQNPTGGTSVAEGSSVSLVISLGPVMVTVPNVAGLTQAAAGSAITTAGLTIGPVSTANSDTIPAGSVISQNPTAGNSVPQGTAVNLTISLGPQGPPLPPDPSTVAPPVDPTVATTVDTATSFLYTGPYPIQTGVWPGTIETRRAAVLRGKVMDRNETPLPGVTITVLNHSEYGQTLSRSDGVFDMVVNGGGPLTVNYAREGFLTAQRQVRVPWQDYARLPDVVLISVDGVVAQIDLTAATPIQVARGSVATDGDGARQATLLFSGGTQAQMILADGSAQHVNALNVRATEYTVGPRGPNAMPAELPATSGYTYAVELSADEAMTAGAVDIQFSRPVYFYVENFVGFPVGGAVPTGYYDRKRDLWVPSKNGQVIRVVSITAGLADVDTDGDGASDDPSILALLNITDAEREKLATLYAAGQSLWRVPVTHFTPWDCNWPFGPPDDAKAPMQPEPVCDDQIDAPYRCTGSIIECQNQVLGETVGITGTPFSLHYQSDRVSGRKAANTLKISLSGQSIPASLKRIELELLIAGRIFTQSFPALPNLNTSFTWDGKDAYGRVVQGNQHVTVRIGFVYDGVYMEPAEAQQAFGLYSGTAITISRARAEFTMWQESIRAIAAWNAQGMGFGGWQLDIHHSYDPVGKILYMGNGSRRSAESMKPIVKRIAGNGQAGYGGDGGPATEAQLNLALSLAAGPDGSLYIGDYYNNRIRRVAPDGTISTFAGNGSRGHSGDNGPATEAMISWPRYLAVGADGSLYFAEQAAILSNEYIRRIRPDGKITTVASYQSIEDLAIGPDDSLYFSFNDYAPDYWVYKLVPGGVPIVVAGNGTQGFSGDGGPATQAQLSEIRSLAVGSDGSVYIADYGNHRIRKVSPDGIIRTVAGDGAAYGTAGNGDGGLATQAQVGYPSGVAVSWDGSIFIATNSRIRRVTTDGIISTVAGGGTSAPGVVGGPATAASIGVIYGLATGPDHSIYIAEPYDTLQVTRPIPGVSVGDTVIPSEGGEEVYVFDSGGRHLRTLDALTWAVLYEFSYANDGKLAAVTDRDGQVTSIERDGDGHPTGIVSPYAQRTALAVDGAGFLTSITNPAGEMQQFGYSNEGLMTSFIDPRGNAYVFTYDELGRLTKDQDPEGGYQALSRTETSNLHDVTLTTALNRSTVYRVENLPTGDKRMLDTFPTGLQSESLSKTDGSTKITYPEGTVINQVLGPDPRFGMQSPLAMSFSISTPGAVVFNVTTNSTATADPVTGLLNLSEIVTVNNKSYTSLYDAAARTFSDTTPAGRQSTVSLDEKSRVAAYEAGGLHPLHFEYDANGHLASITQGSALDGRSVQFSYNLQGYLQRVTDPLLQSHEYQYDAAGRVTKEILPDGRQVGYSYDANGNIASITPPGRPAHSFVYTVVDLVSKYIPPEVGAGSNATQYFYDKDRNLTQISRPDSVTVSFGYDSGGRLSTITYPGGVLSYSYSASKGTLSSITAPDGAVLNYTYDGSLLTTETWGGAISGTVSRAYNSDFQITSHTVNGGSVITYQYDSDSLLTRAGNLVLTRDLQSGLITGTTLGPVSDTLGYNGYADLTAHSVTYNAMPLFNQQFSYDNMGRLIQQVETISDTTETYDYRYDSAGRLTQVEKNGVTTAAYAYDSNDNRVGYTYPGGTVTGTYDTQDRLIQYGPTVYTYTANGELLTRTAGSQAVTYAYDVFGNLRGATLPDGTQVEYLIDGNNRRIGKKVNGAVVQGFLYEDAFKPIAELDGNSTVVSRFVYATGINVPEYMVKNGTTYRIITDHLGSPRLVINIADGAIAQRMDYDEFGNVLNDTNPGFQPFGFAGGLYDSVTKLVRFGARDYDPETGRWTARDPVGFGADNTNLYNYASNDPINRLDPLGLWELVLPGPNIDVKKEQGYPSKEGEYTVDAHALPDPEHPTYSSVWEKIGGKWRKVSVKDLADRIKRDPRSRGKKIRLIVCNIAGPYTEELANILKQIVIAAVKKVKVFPDGTWALEKQKGNKFVTYYPSNPLYGIDY